MHASVTLGGKQRSITDIFAVGDPDQLSAIPAVVHPGTSAQEQHFHSRPDLRPPVVNVRSSSPAQAPGDVFVAPYGGVGEAGPMILDPSGGLLWFKAMPPHTTATNLRVQEYLGKPVLTWWQGHITHGFGVGAGVIANSAYEDIAHVHAGNGLQEDLHELQLTPSGTALITAYFPIYCNLSGAGGVSWSAVADSVMQEVDVRTGLVTYEWNSLDHVALSDSYSLVRHFQSTEFPFDFFHINSINLDRDGSLLVSSRNTWAVYDVEPSTGKVSWRLGGKHSSFKGEAGTSTAWQHDGRELPDGSFSIYDNGSSPKIHPQSRGIVVALDPQHHTATLRAQLVHVPALLAESQGNVQALANGDWFVGWGQNPYFTEFGPEGKILFDARFQGETESYRSLRFPWFGQPSHPPVLAFTASGKHAGTVYASWNGATEVASWRLLAGASASSLHALLTAPRSGFETAIALPGGTVGPYLAVQALDAAGNVLGSSVAVSESALR